MQYLVPQRAQKLEELGFLKDNNIHDSIRNIVLSSVEGDGVQIFGAGTDGSATRLYHGINFSRRLIN